MKWIKASERLPDKVGKYWVRFINHRGEQKTGSRFDGFAFPHHKSEVEWLDETVSDGVKWRDTNDYPEKSGMYVTEVAIEEDGQTYRPVAYNHYDKILGRWTNVRSCAKDGSVSKWLDESPSTETGQQPTVDKEADLDRLSYNERLDKIYDLLKENEELKAKLNKDKGEYKFDPHIEYPDLTGLSDKEKKDFIDGLAMEMGKHTLAAFMALGLDHYMDFTINDGKDYFRFHFYKIDIKSPNHDHLTILKLQSSNEAKEKEIERLKELLTRRKDLD